MREAHSAVLAELRAVDPAADAYYLGTGVWVLGARQPMTSVRDQAFRRSIGQALELPESEARDARVAFLRYRLATGFTPVCEPVAIRQDTEWAVAIKDFRRRTWIWENAADEGFEEALEASDMDNDLHRRMAVMHDYADSELDFLEAFGIRGVRRFVMPGLN